MTEPKATRLLISGLQATPSPLSTATRRSRQNREGRVRERAAGDLGEDLLHDGVATVLTSSPGQLEWGIGEDHVVAPGRKQLALPVSGLLVQVPDPADDQSRGDGQAPFRRERRVPHLGDDGRDRNADAGVHRSGAGETRAVTADRVDHCGVVERSVQPGHDHPGAAAVPGAGVACAARLAAGQVSACQQVCPISAASPPSTCLNRPPLKGFPTWKDDLHAEKYQRELRRPAQRTSCPVI